MKNNVKRKAFKAALASSLAVGAVVAVAPVYSDAATSSFKDLSPSTPYYSAVLNLADRGIISGYPGGLFKAENSVTRGQAAKIIANTIKIDQKNFKDPGFTDIGKGHQFYPAVGALVNAGILSGFEDSTFRPDETLTRSQMAKVISLAFDFDKQTYTNRFKDVSEGQWFKDYVQALISNDVTRGTSPTTFSPYAPVKRGDLASFVVRAEAASKNPPVTPPVTPPVDPPVNPPVNPPVTPPAGNAPLQAALDVATDTIESGTPAVDRIVDIDLVGNTFEVEIKKADATFADFRAVAQPVFDLFNDKMVVNSAVVTIKFPSGATATISDGSVTNYKNLEDILQAALTKVGMKETDPITSYLKGSQVVYQITGSYNNQSVDTSYTFNFK